MNSSISSKELELLYQKKPIRILDVREENEYAIEHIPGSVLLPLSAFLEITSRLDKNVEYYVVCAGGGRSLLASEQLTELGFRVVYVEGGLKDWSGETQSS